MNFPKSSREAKSPHTPSIAELPSEQRRGRPEDRSDRSPAIVRFLRAEHGASMLEYGLMLAMIATVALTCLGLLGLKTGRHFTQPAQQIQPDLLPVLIQER